MRLAPSITRDERRSRMRDNAARYHIPRLRYAGDNAVTVAICGYGPSLADTWELARDCDVVMTVSGAHDFLIGRGITPDYHLECDPRAYKAQFLKRPHESVTYLINSQCHDAVFDALAGQKIVMWHGFTDDDARMQVSLVNAAEPDARLIGGGTNAGMRAILVAREMGFMNFHLHGFDCCYRGDKQWAGAHLGQRHRTVSVEVDGRVFETSDLMMVATDDFFLRTLPKLPGCRFSVHGDGLLEARLKIYNSDPEKAMMPGWFKPVNFTIREPRSWRGDTRTRLIFNRVLPGACA